MPIDPITATAIGATGKWMWDNYGKTFVDGWAKGVGGSREKKQLERQWHAATQTYLEKLYNQSNWLRLLGKKEGMPLERIYTDLNVLDQPTAEKWYDRTMLEEDYVQRRSFHGRREAERQDGLKVAKQFDRLYILGKPGAGKTTFMKFMTLETLRGKLGEKIPIFITLKELSDKGQAILPFMAEQLRQCGFEDAEWFVTELLKAGRAVVLFDGLDEVNLANEKRSTLIAAMKDFVKEFEKCQVLITCRIAASDYSFARFKYVEMADFSEVQQKRFIFKWFQDDMARRDACWQALSDSKSRNLRELAYVPLLLTLLCITYERRGEFPPDRDEVYRTAVNALLFEWDSTRLIKRDAVYEGLDVKYRERLLAWIAYETFSRSDYLLEEAKLAALIEVYLATVPRIEAAVDGLSVLKTIEAQHGLLVERAQGIYSFSHLTLQEYFTARYVVDNAQEALPQLVTHVGEDPWREVFLLTAGMLYGADAFAQQYVQALDGMIAKDRMLVATLQWGAEKSTELATGVQPAAARAFFFFRALALDRDLDLARALARVLDLARAIALDRARDRDRDLDRDLTLTLDLDRDRDRDLALDLARDLALDLTLTLDRDLARARARARDLDRALDRDLARALNLDLDLDLDLDRDLARDLARALACALARDLALDLAISYDLRLLAQLSDDSAKIVQQLQDWSRQQPNLPDWLPPALAILDVLPDYEQLEPLLLHYWGLDQFWEFSRKQLDLLNQYLMATNFLVECLQVATVQDRAAIEAQLLLPPKWESRD